MKINMIKTFSITCTAAFLCSCVSVNIANNEHQKAKGVEFKSPESPFKSLRHEQLDGLWRNEGNGNSISFLSDCNSPSDPPLETIQKNVISDVEDKQVISAKFVSFNRRRALRSSVSGSIDGIPSKMDILIFKKNNCIYILNYVALQTTYFTDIGRFEKFLNGFTVP